MHDTILRKPGRTDRRLYTASSAASASFPLIWDEHSIQESSPPTLDVCRSQRVARPASRVWDCSMGH
jgi:hypothetical protein